MKIKYKPNTKKELKTLCDDETINLGEIDTSKITDMSCLFYKSSRRNFSGLENWDVSNVTNMSFMFNDLDFPKFFCGDGLENWDVSKVRDMSNMFGYCSKLNTENIKNWNVSYVIDMTEMFIRCGDEKSFGDLSSWKVTCGVDPLSLFCETEQEKKFYPQFTNKKEKETCLRRY